MECSPAKLASTIPCTNRCVASLINTESGSARACKRAAKFTVSPRTVTPASAPSCTFPTTAAPVLRPIRKCGRTPCLLSRSGPCGLQSLQDRERRTTGPQRRVFECDRRAEDRHDAVAGKALNDAALLAHGVVHQLRQAAHQRESGFLSRSFGEAS